jgi:hypothetical protein
MPVLHSTPDVVLDDTAIAGEREMVAELRGQWLSAALLGQAAVDSGGAKHALTRLLQRVVPQAVDVRIRGTRGG